MKTKFLNLMWTLLMIVAITCSIYSIYKIYTTNKNYKEIDKVNEEIQQIYTQSDTIISNCNDIDEKNITEFKVDWKSIKNINNDVIAWIVIPNTNINYPILQSKQNSEEYLRKNIYKEYSSGGSIFIDYNLEKPFDTVNTVIYGHNMNNGSMFASLTKYSEEQFALNNNIVLIYLPTDEIKKYIIFCFSEVESNNIDIYNIDVEDSKNYYNNIIKNSKYNLLKNTDNLDSMQFITLSTCTNKNKDKRYIINAYLVQ